MQSSGMILTDIGSNGINKNIVYVRLYKETIVRYYRLLHFARNDVVFHLHIVKFANYFNSSFKN